MLRGSKLILPSQLLFLIIALSVLLSTSGCRDGEDLQESKQVHSSGCINCHDIIPDQHHDFSCSDCHQGQELADTLPEAHQNLVSQPAHPDNAEQSCGSCHGDEVAMVSSNSHYTLNQHISKIRNAFTPSEQPESIDNIQPSEAPDTVIQLVDDLLRRRCLRCHVYYKGDDFPLTRRAAGCGACHLEYYNSQITSHTFIRKPGDSRCLSCHYGNHVGFDYYGRYEHDFNDEYRTPYTTHEDFFRPYGVEYHQLDPDIHQQAGMICIDCHGKDQLMSAEYTTQSCSACHAPETLKNGSHDSITFVDSKYLFTSKATGTTIELPVISHPAHKKYQGIISCQGCHARWSFGDEETHLVRIDHDDFDELDKLSLDGSSETLRILASHMEFDGEWLEPEMIDTFTGERFPGIWRKGFLQRRWENLSLEPDNDGILQVVRPLLDLHLSWIDAEENLRFDNITVREGTSAVQYAPHTIGKAGPFFEQRFRHLIKGTDLGQSK